MIIIQLTNTNIIFIEIISYRRPVIKITHQEMIIILQEKAVSELDFISEGME